MAIVTATVGSVFLTLAGASRCFAPGGITAAHGTRRLPQPSRDTLLEQSAPNSTVGPLGFAGRSVVALAASLFAWKRLKIPSRRTAMRQRLKEYYEALGLPEGSTRAEVKRAFKKLATRHHPDKVGDSAEFRKALEAKNTLYQALPKKSNRRTKYLFVGNPGTGKSTILNGLVGELTFKSGISFGKGMTFKLDRRMRDGDEYMDTPGLADEALRKQAAEAIQEALKEGGHFKIFFVITLESGRLRPADKTTMKMVLESAPIKEYGVIINKVSRNLYDQVVHNPDKEDPSPLQQFLGHLWAGFPNPSTNIHVNPHSAALEDRNDVFQPLASDVEHFIEGMPTTYLQKGEAKDINYDDFSKLEKMFEEQLAEMRRDRAVQMETIRAYEVQMRELQRRLEEAERHEEEQMIEFQGLQGRLEEAVRQRQKSGWCCIS